MIHPIVSLKGSIALTSRVFHLKRKLPPFQRVCNTPHHLQMKVKLSGRKVPQALSQRNLYRKENLRRTFPVLSLVMPLLLCSKSHHTSPWSHPDQTQVRVSIQIICLRLHQAIKHRLRTLQRKTLIRCFKASLLTTITGMNFGLPKETGSAEVPKKFPGIQEFGDDDDSDSDVEHGFDDDFTTTSPRRQPAKEGGQSVEGGNKKSGFEKRLVGPSKTTIHANFYFEYFPITDAWCSTIPTNIRSVNAVINERPRRSAVSIQFFSRRV